MNLRHIQAALLGVGLCLATATQAAEFTTSSAVGLPGEESWNSTQDFTVWKYAFNAIESPERGFVRGVGIANYMGGYALVSKAERGWAMSDMGYSTSFTNDKGIGMNFSMNLLLDAGHLQVGHMPLIDPEGTYLEASYGAEVRVNGVRVWHSSSTLVRDGSSVSLTREGADLNPFSAGWSFGSFNWNKQSFEIDLGYFDYGESAKVEFFAGSSAYSNPASYAACFGSPAYSTYVACAANAHYGDPATIDGNPTQALFSILPAAAQAVPEPSALALVGLGLIGAVGWRRRQR